MTDLACYNCGAPLASVPLPLSRRADCPSCRAELHCCRMCRFFDRGAPDQCLEERAEPPANREAANVCEWLAPGAGLEGAVSPTASASARSRLDALFEAPSEVVDPGRAEGVGESGDADDDAAREARRKLDDLFG